VTKVIKVLQYDGFLSYYDTNYDNAWGASEANSIYSSDVTLDIGQAFDEGYYIIWRGFLYFDTSIIPDGATILSANLTLYMKVSTFNDFKLIIQNGQPTYPHMPMQAADYYQGYYTGNGGEINASTLGADYAQYNITLNSNGLEWINKQGVTKLCLRTSRDILSSAFRLRVYKSLHLRERLTVCAETHSQIQL